MITASGLSRVMACPGSEALPHIHRTSEAAESGTARHTYLEHVGKVGKEAALDLVPEEYREMCDDIDIDGLPTDLASEVSFAWDYATGKARELGRGLDRDYSSCGPTEIAGTIDVLGVADDRVYLGDYKGYALVKAEDNAQLLFAAICATEIYKKGIAVIEIINIRGGKNFRSRATVDTFDLADFSFSLGGIIEKVQIHRCEIVGGKPPPVTEGPHCRYCPAFDACPAKTAMMRNMINGREANELEMIVPLTPETAAHVYRTYRAMEALTKRAKDIIYAYAAERPIDIGDGKVFGSREKQGNEMLDGDITYEVIRKQFGQWSADLAVSRKATKAGIGKAIKAAEIDGTVKAATDRILTEIRELGGSTRKTVRTTDEHRAEIPESTEEV